MKRKTSTPYLEALNNLARYNKVLAEAALHHDQLMEIENCLDQITQSFKEMLNSTIKYPEHLKVQMEAIVNTDRDIVK